MYKNEIRTSLVKYGITLLLFFVCSCSKIPIATGDSNSTEGSQESELQVTEYFSQHLIAGVSGNLAVDSKGALYYANINGYVIQKVDSNGIQSVFAGSGSPAYADGTGTGASFYAPLLVTVDKSDNVYVADGFKIRKITSGGVVSTLASMGNGGTARGLAVDGIGSVYFVFDDSTATTHVIKKASSSGVVSIFAGASTSGNLDGVGTAAKFNYPRGLAVDSNDNLFVVDSGNYLIRKISSSSSVSTFAGTGSQGTQDGPGSAASFSFYSNQGHIAIDKSNNLYVTDLSGTNRSDSHKIRKITSTGVVSNYCGSENYYDFVFIGSCSAVGVFGRFGIAINSDGKIFFADTGSIYKISK